MDNNMDITEFLEYIRYKESLRLDYLQEREKLLEYLLSLNEEMIEKYPEMIVKIYTKEENYEGDMER